MQVVGRARSWTSRYDGGLTLLHVVEHFTVDRSNEEIAPEDQDPAAYHEQRARESMAALVEQAGLGDVRQIVVESTGAAKHEVVRYAQDHGNDLIVMGSHGIHGMAVLLGSTSDGVLHRAGCDVLVVRSG